MWFESEPIFDEARVVEELDGDRELLFEIVELYREKIIGSFEKLSALPRGSRESLRIASDIAEHAARIRACRLERLARELVMLDPSPGPIGEAVSRLEIEYEQFLAETQLMI